ncbi:hypothetical protein, partial [Micromonospora sp. NPDC050695]|uniref:very short patch repair endonuclease n=1 Tax=Micromonospora sp. NPDC050695 TaxID=3154938 RepID=UPI0033CB619F
MSDESWAANSVVRRSMQSNRSRDTKPELVLRRALHARGLRYRVCTKPLPDLRMKADIVFRPARVAVEIKGCFWHGCPQHYRRPAANSAYWSAKVARNIARDEKKAGSDSRSICLYEFGENLGGLLPIVDLTGSVV